jgi:hypothetical protein
VNCSAYRSEPWRQLERQARGRSVPVRVEVRSQIVLLAANAIRTSRSASNSGSARGWRRYGEGGFSCGGAEGLLKDVPGPGRTPSIQAAVISTVIERTTLTTPAYFRFQLPRQPGDHRLRRQARTSVSADLTILLRLKGLELASAWPCKVGLLPLTEWTELLGPERPQALGSTGPPVTPTSRVSELQRVGQGVWGVEVDVFSPDIRKVVTARPSPRDLCLFERFSGS